MKTRLAILSLIAILFALFSDHIVSYYLNTDLYNYWLLSQRFLRGFNPYDLQALQASADPNLNVELGPAHFGPWNFVILFPLLAWPFPVSVLLYLLFTTTSIFLLAEVCSSLIPPKNKQQSVSLFLVALFSPFLLTYIYGQISIFVALFTYLALRSFRKNKEIFCGALLGLSALKPHLAYLLWVALTVDIVRKRRWRTLVTACFTLGVLSGLAEIINPSILTNWLDGLGSSLGYLSASLITPMRLMIATPNNPFPPLPALAIPALMILGTALYFLRQQTINLLSSAPTLLVLSLLTAPYVWPFDYAILIGLHIGIFSAAAANRSSRVILTITLGAYALFLLQFFSSDLLLSVSTYWFPPVLLCVYQATNDLTARR